MTLAQTPESPSAPAISPSAPINLADVEARARTVLPRAAADYFAGGAEDEVSLRANRAVFESIALRPRYLVDVSRRSLTTRVLGTDLALPVLLAPTGFQKLAHADGELATARAAAEAGTIMVLSTFSTVSLEEVQRATPAPKWFQLYVHKDRGLTRNLVDRAHSAGYTALVLTVDVPVLGRRERDLRNGFVLPPELRVANFDMSQSESLHDAGEESGLAQFHRGLREPSFGLKDVDWLATLSPLPILLKGVLRGDDARAALDHGVSGILVSNHGGRQLDGAISGIRALPDVVEQVGGRCEVLVDGGVRRGTDIVKALALGARAVLIGRPMVWGLAWNGASGVVEVLRILAEELDTAMALCGACSPVQLTSDLVAR
ncbi:MAG TPA: alpha-hydroxy acid oxidase [Gemmatimonadales bacterium]